MMKKREIAVCGYRSVAAVFARQPGCVLRLFYLEATARQAGPFCREMARAKKPYRMVLPEELERIGGTHHHGGLVAVTVRDSLERITPEDLSAWSRTGRPVLLLDRVSNHHNLGAIVRSAAFFGITEVVLGEHRDQALPSEASYRIAEGGMEFVTLKMARDPVTVLTAARDSFATVATVVRGRSVRPDSLKKRKDLPWMIVMGNEERGVSEAVAAACQYHVSIPGSGVMESLNVSATAAVMMAWATQSF